MTHALCNSLRSFVRLVITKERKKKIPFHIYVVESSLAYIVRLVRCLIRQTVPRVTVMLDVVL